MKLKIALQILTKKSRCIMNLDTPFCKKNEASQKKKKKNHHQCTPKQVDAGQMKGKGKGIKLHNSKQREISYRLTTGKNRGGRELND